MTKILFGLVLGLFVSSLDAAPAPETGWQQVDSVLGISGKDLPGGVHKFSWPRTDLRVQKGGVSVEPALALGSWAAFRGDDRGRAVAMGDLVLLESEVSPVVETFEKEGFEV